MDRLDRWMGSIPPCSSKVTGFSSQPPFPEGSGVPSPAGLTVILRFLCLPASVRNQGPDSPTVTIPFLYCLRRGLRLKDGSGSARAAPVSVGLRQVVHPLAIGQDRSQQTWPATRRVADGERMNPQGRGGASREASCTRKRMCRLHARSTGETRSESSRVAHCVRQAVEAQ
jgi:hypothetical protein